MKTRDLLVISDLHLGEDLGAKTRRTEILERELIEFLDYHREEGVPWRLVINGDMIELVGLMILPAEASDTGEVHPDDHHYGLGGREAAAAVKLAAVMQLHAAVFAALARFVGAGHELSVVIGNHDAELHWPKVQDAFVDNLCAHWSDQRPGSDGDRFRDRIGFHPWFFHVQGVVWIEHGHQYDPYCSFEEVLEPATDEEEIDPNVGGLLLRYVCRQLEEDLHTAWGGTFFGYLAIWLRQGPRTIANILLAYVDMCRRLVQHWRMRAPERLAARRRRAQLRRAKLADTLRIPEPKLRELSRLWHPPVVVDLGRIMRAVMLDRLLVLIGTPVVFRPGGVAGALVVATLGPRGPAAALGRRPVVGLRPAGAGGSPRRDAGHRPTESASWWRCRSW